MGTLLDKSKQPDDEVLKAVLGNTFKLWNEIKSGIVREFGTVTEEWKFYGAKSGWTMKLLLKKRNLFFLIPEEGFFITGFVFGDKAVAEIEKSGLPDALITDLVQAKKYAEGRGLRMEVKDKKAVNNVLKLVAIKLNN
jgi:hypothetical protein